MKTKGRKALVVPGFVLLAVFAFAPLVIMFIYSLQAHGDGSFTAANYLNIFSKSVYTKLIWSTIRVSFTVTVFCLVLAYPLAYIMANKMGSGKYIILALMIIPFFTNQLVRVYSWLIMLQTGGILESVLKSMHLLNGPLNILYTKAATTIGLIHASFPTMVLTIFLALERVDNNLLDAGRSLGASRAANFLHITLPLSLPGVISGITMVFVPNLGTFVEARILGGAENAMIGTVIENQFISVNNWEFGAAIAFFLLLLVLISMGLLNRLERRYSTK